MKNVIFVFALVVLGISCNSPAMAYERIFYEDCEDTDFATHFLEDNYGSGTQVYWEEMIEKMDQSNTAYRGSYSMSYQPWLDNNPHTVIGIGTDAVSGANLSGFDLSSYNSRYWYFRWYQRWDTTGHPDGASNKLLYINYATAGDFTFNVVKTGDDSLYPQGKDRDNRDFVVRNYITSPSLDDDAWHKFELFIDCGTTGNGNGNWWLKVDNDDVTGVGVPIPATNVTFNGTIHSNPMEYITGWPSNTSGTFSANGQRTWLDELEIYTLTGPTDIPPEIGGGSGGEPTLNPPDDFRHD